MIETALKNISAIEKAVLEANDLQTFRMWVLRDAYGADRLGVHVLKAIEKELAGHGLGYFPAPLPGNQWDCVRVFKRGTLIGDLIEAALNVGDEFDQKLREGVGDVDTKNTLRRVRELVCP